MKWSTLLCTPCYISNCKPFTNFCEKVMESLRFLPSLTVLFKINLHELFIRDVLMLVT